MGKYPPERVPRHSNHIRPVLDLSLICKPSPYYRFPEVHHFSQIALLALNG